MSIINIQYFESPYGEMVLGSYKDQLCLCDWRYRKMRQAIDKRLKKGLNAIYEEDGTSTIEEAKKQLVEYFEKERKDFDIPILMVGTSFQQSIWNELLKIPYGETDTYLGLSKKINNEKVIRAVASANGANAISIFIPCHRVVGSKGELIGYAGGLGVKKKLLQLENNGNTPEQLELFG